MSIWSTIFVDGLKAVVTKVPNLYLAGGILVILSGAFIGGKIWFHNEVEKRAQVIVNAYVEKDKKDDAELSEINVKDNQKILIQYQDRVQVITKVVHDNAQIIEKKVPDVNKILSNGWVSAFNSAVEGQAINPSSAANDKDSGVTATQALETIAENDGICKQNSEQLTELQQWIKDKQSEVAAMNRKNGAVK